MKLSLSLLLAGLCSTANAFSPSFQKNVLQNLREVSMAPPGGRGGAAEPDYRNSGALCWTW